MSVGARQDYKNVLIPILYFYTKESWWIMEKDSFILYTSFYEPLKYLTDLQMGKLFKAIFEYQINGNDKVDDDIRIAFEFIKNQLNIDAEKWEDKKSKRSDAGRIGGIKRAINKGQELSSTSNQCLTDLSTSKQSQANLSKTKQCLANVSTLKQSQANQAVNVNDNVNVNVNDNVKEIIKEKNVQIQQTDWDGIEPKKNEKFFCKPTVEEIKAYCFERNNGINAQYFYDFYESKGWCIGKNKMKDWRACVRTWEKNRQDNTSSVNVKNTYKQSSTQCIDFEKYYSN